MSALEPLPEASRRAYLRAMGIPVWVDRAEAPEPAVATLAPQEAKATKVDSASQPRNVPPPSTGVGIGVRERLKASMPATSKLGAPGSSSKADAESTRERTTVQDSPQNPAIDKQRVPAAPVSLRFFSSSGVVMVTDSDVSEKTAQQLLSGIVFALIGQNGATDSILFQWPPPGLQVDASETSAAAVSRLAKVRDTSGLDLVLLLGDAASQTMLTAEASLRPQVLDVPAVCIEPFHELVANPLLKRKLWSAIAPYRKT